LSKTNPTTASDSDSKIHLDYRAVFEAAPDGIVVVNDKGVIVEVNPRAQAQFGYASEELVGQPVEKLVPETHRGSHAGRRAEFHGKPDMRPMGVGLVLSGRRKNGSEFPVEISLSPGRAGEQDLVIAVVRDVTERSQLRAFGQGALRAAEEERQRISRELHDDTAQLLATLLVRVKLVDNEKDEARREEMLEELRVGLHEASDSVRRIARGLRPPALEDAGVVAALQAYIRNLFENQDVRSSFDAGAVDQLLDADRKLVLYRVVQEALSNVVRHSGAATVSVQVKVEGAWVIALVEDDGSGFEEVRIGGGGGLGLVGMRERAVGAGGRVSVESELGRGTRVRLAIPLSNGEHKHG
jgi:PAS domain S-box-containing protein